MRRFFFFYLFIFGLAAAAEKRGCQKKNYKKSLFYSIYHLSSFLFLPYLFFSLTTLNNNIPIRKRNNGYAKFDYSSRAGKQSIVYHHR